ncbi:MAG TPA: hypothetical protein G4O07_07130 [Dehalococcoidia bacterium]|nr:hypothetical protein [Dehalococcoidia bacterium]
MKSLDLEPGYSTGNIPGRCIKCLAEKELNDCLRTLLMGAGDEREVQQQYEMLLSFLKSPESKQLRDESERLLSEGKQVSLNISIDKETGETKYGLN